MSLVSPDRHDVFISYSHDDNAFFADYVKKFRDELVKRLGPAVRRRCPSQITQEPDVFIDESGIPASGELNAALKEHVERSELLFVFVGKLYLNSEYCGKELDWFRDRFQGITKTALKRTFIIVLEPDALEEARNKFSSPDVVAIVQPFYGQESKTPIGLTQPDKNGEFESKFGRLLDTAAKRIVDIVEAPKAHAQIVPIGGDDGERKIMLGIVPPRLENLRRELGRMLQDGGAVVHFADRDDFLLTPDQVRRRAQQARFFVQPFDFGEVELERHDPPGGHLARQAALLDGTGIEHHWWLVSEANSLAMDQTPAESGAEHLHFLNSKAEIAERVPLDAFAERLLEKLKPSKTICRVMIEYTATDQETRAQLKCFRGLLKTRWAVGKRAGCQLTLLRANWQSIHEDRAWHYNYHGFIMVDRSKTLSALDNQVSDITSRVLGSAHRLVCGLFTLPPKEDPTLEPDEAVWSALIVFRRDKGENLVLDAEGEAQLEQFFDRVHSAAASGDSVERPSDLISHHGRGE
jgi:hypothetical protein